MLNLEFIESLLYSDWLWFIDLFIVIGNGFGVLVWLLVGLLLVWFVYYLIKKWGFFVNLSLFECIKVIEELVILILFVEIKSKDLLVDLIVVV